LAVGQHELILAERAPIVLGVFRADMLISGGKGGGFLYCGAEGFNGCTIALILRVIHGRQRLLARVE
jgi:hypothetical protein